MKRTFIISTGLRLIVEWLAIYVLIGSMIGRWSIITWVLCICSIYFGMFLGARVLKYFPTCADGIALVISGIACILCAIPYHELNTVDVVVACACSGLMVEAFGGHILWR